MNIVPDVLARANVTANATSKGNLDQCWDLNGKRVSKARLGKLVLRATPDGRRADNVGLDIAWPDLSQQCNQCEGSECLPSLSAETRRSSTSLWS